MIPRNSLPAVTAKNYFDPEIEMAFMGSTQIKNFMHCEAAELARLRGEYQTPKSTAMLVGSYVDAHFEGTLDVFRAQHPELFKRDGTLKAEFVQANEIIDRMERDELYMLLMSGRKQKIFVGEIAGVPIKIKIDSLLDADACMEIVRKFPAAQEALGLCAGAIVDQKVMRSLDDVWSEEDRQRVSWWKAWRYDVQGAIYQAVEGHYLPFILAAGTKDGDIRAVYLPDTVLTAALAEVEDLLPGFQAVKEGRRPPTRCGNCPYCRATRTLTSIESGEDQDGEEISI